MDGRPWKGINKCLLCGTRLKFESIDGGNTDKGEGKKSCRQNHDPFVIVGRFNSMGDFKLKFILPGDEEPYYALSSV